MWGQTSHEWSRLPQMEIRSARRPGRRITAMTSLAQHPERSEGQRTDVRGRRDLHPSASLGQAWDDNGNLLDDGALDLHLRPRSRSISAFDCDV